MPNYADRVKESTTTTGTGPLTLGGTSTGFQAFATAFVNGTQVDYTIQGQGGAGADWEVGYGTLNTGTGTLSRDEVYASCNGGALVNLAVGTKDVFCDWAARKAMARAVHSELLNGFVAVVPTDEAKMSFQDLQLDGSADVLLQGAADLVVIGG